LIRSDAARGCESLCSALSIYANPRYSVLIASQWPGRAYDNDSLIKASISVGVIGSLQTSLVIDFSA